jgi:hypothetical protein
MARCDAVTRTCGARAVHALWVSRMAANRRVQVTGVELVDNVTSLARSR